MQDTIYLDNAATTFPKPEVVLQDMMRFYRRHGLTPGRSGSELSQVCARHMDDTRRRLHELFANPSPDKNRLVFCANATAALNLGIAGLLREGDHVVSTRLEHNSVLRPLEMLRREGRITYELVPSTPEGYIDPKVFSSAMTSSTRLAVVNHASNVLGSVQDLDAMGAACRERGVFFLVDAAQSAGLLPIDMASSRIDLLAFTGHKSLLGPTGTGGLAVGPDVPIRATVWGGTGVDSADIGQPDRFPYRLEAGTPNVLGIAGLHAGLDYIGQLGRDNLLAQELSLRAALHDGLSQIRGVTVQGPAAETKAVAPVLSCTIAGMDAEEAGQRLDIDHGIIVRTGLQCAPLVHADRGTGEAGGIRFSFGPLNTTAHVVAALDAMSQLASLAAGR